VLEPVGVLPLPHGGVVTHQALRRTQEHPDAVLHRLVLLLSLLLSRSRLLPRSNELVPHNRGDRNGVSTGIGQPVPLLQQRRACLAAVHRGLDVSEDVVAPEVLRDQHQIADQVIVALHEPDDVALPADQARHPPAGQAGDGHAPLGLQLGVVRDQRLLLGAPLVGLPQRTSFALVTVAVRADPVGVSEHPREVGGAQHPGRSDGHLVDAGEPVPDHRFQQCAHLRCLGLFVDERQLPSLVLPQLERRDVVAHADERGDVRAAKSGAPGGQPLVAVRVRTEDLDGGRGIDAVYGAAFCDCGHASAPTRSKGTVGQNCGMDTSSPLRRLNAS